MASAFRRGMMLLMVGIALTAGGARARRTPACGGGRFYVVVDGAAVFPPIGSRIDVGTRSIRLDASCGASAARVRSTAKGIVVRARWSACGTLRHVRLAARVDGPACTMLRGTVRATGMKAEAILARRSVCGDGHLDAPDEACESSTDCAAGEFCTSTCACESDEGPTTTTTTIVDGSTTTVTDPGTTTTTIAGPSGCHVESIPYQAATHVPVGTTIDWTNDPPASGPHYPFWATYASHTDTIPRGYWVHNLEHGAIVLLYRPDAPAAVVGAVQAAYAAIPNDPECGHKRALVTPDPLLDRSFAAVAWNYVMECTGVVDVQSVLDFTAQRRNHGGEDICQQGAFD